MKFEAAWQVVKITDDGYDKKQINRIEFETDSIGSAKAKITNQLKKCEKLAETEEYKEFSRIKGKWNDWKETSRYYYKEGYLYTEKRTGLFPLKDYSNYYIAAFMIWEDENKPKNEFKNEPEKEIITEEETKKEKSKNNEKIGYTVTQKHIDEGEPFNQFKHPIYTAAEESETHEFCSSSDSSFNGINFATGIRDYRYWKKYYFDEKLKNWVVDFNMEQEVHPITVELKDAEAYIVKESEIMSKNNVIRFTVTEKHINEAVKENANPIFIAAAEVEGYTLFENETPHGISVYIKGHKWSTHQFHPDILNWIEDFILDPDRVDPITIEIELYNAIAYIV